MRLLTLILFYVQFKLNLSQTVPSSTCNSESEIEDFYWRNYNCVIPKDAIAGGFNSRGNTTYIGQVLHHNQIIPARIDPEEKKVTYEWGYMEYVAEINIKILCSSNKDQFEWVTTGNRLINNITDKHFVVGGYEPNITLLIGRKLINGELVVGKVVFTKSQSTLNTTKDGKGTQHGEFEVLAYRGLKQQEQQTNVQGNTNSCAPKLLRSVIISLYS